ncbi:MAG: SUMF1/EgtB/PvdO family nonheme iron enzyme [Spirochaetales bacterium]|nr:SUMF1/EgtB/PvdO family nonheme iron enzyme [Spirochaetales bacterium]
MRKLLIFLLTAIMVIVSACSQKIPENFVLVKGGTFKSTETNYSGTIITISDFYISKYEITQKEWIEVMRSNPSEFKGDNLPVEMVSWYDCVEYCNKRSIKEGLKPYYNIDKNKKDPNNKSDIDDIKWMVTINKGANGYRLPTEAQWEYASSGGRESKSYLYSGSNNADDVAWYWENSGDKPLTGYWNFEMIENNHNKTKPVGLKIPNELGLYDMSGNVREWCWDWYGDWLSNKIDPGGSVSGTDRVWKGGGWLGIADGPSYRGYWEPNSKGNDTGLRVCLGK